MKNKQPKSSSSRTSGILIFIVILVPFILYWNTLSNGYSMDDFLVIAKNKQVQQGFKGIGEIFTSHYTDYTDPANGKNYRFDYRPVPKVLFAIEFAIFGEKPSVFHFFNLLYYALTSLVLYVLLRRIFKLYHFSVPLFVTLLFIAHPAHTEVVCSLKNRDEILYFLFCLLSILTFVRFVDKKKIIDLLTGLLCFLIAYYSKASAMVFIVIIPLTIYFFTNANKKQIIIITVSIIGLFAIIYFLPRLYLPAGSRPRFYYENPLFFEHGVWIRLLTSMKVLLFYLRLVIFPYPLAFYYGYNFIPISREISISVVISLLIHTGLLAFAIFGIRRKSVFSYCIFFYLICLSMVSNIAKPVMGIVGDRYIYAASLGFIIALVLLLFRIFKIGPGIDLKQRQFLRLAVLIVPVFIVYSGCTIHRNPDWKSTLSLYSSDIEHLENSSKAQLMIATELYEFARTNKQVNRDSCVRESFLHFKRSLAIYDKLPAAWNNLGYIFYKYYNMPDSGIYCFRQALACDSSQVSTYYNAGDACFDLGKTSDAILFYNMGIPKDPNNEYPWSKLLFTLLRTRDTLYAASVDSVVRKKFPKADWPASLWADYYFRRGDTANAAIQWQEALLLNPGNKTAGEGLQRLGRKVIQ